jgi:hypothetical protein
MGRSFVIDNVESFDGVPYSLVKIDVRHVIDKDSCMHSIRVELKYLRLETNPTVTQKLGQ